VDGLVIPGLADDLDHLRESASERRLKALS
jgi:hypothetical protein